MQLTQHTDYGFRLLLTLARSEDGIVRLPVFAAEQGISYNHVLKVAQELRRAGLVHSHRGRSGGVSLARPASAIMIGEIVRALEPGMCPVQDARFQAPFDCTSNSILASAIAAFFAVLDGKSVADVAEKGKPAFEPWALGGGNSINRQRTRRRDHD